MFLAHIQDATIQFLTKAQASGVYLMINSQKVHDPPEPHLFPLLQAKTGYNNADVKPTNGNIAFLLLASRRQIVGR